jgi:hypothetical protein
MATKIDYNKRAKGQSKREYAASILGGKKETYTKSLPTAYTTKTVAKKTTTSAPKADPRGTPDSYGVYPDGSYDVGGQSYQTKYEQPAQSTSVFNSPIYNYNNPLGLKDDSKVRTSSGTSKSSGSNSRPYVAPTQTQSNQTTSFSQPRPTEQGSITHGKGFGIGGAYSSLMDELSGLNAKGGSAWDKISGFAGDVVKGLNTPGGFLSTPSASASDGDFLRPQLDQPTSSVDGVDYFNGYGPQDMSLDSKMKSEQSKNPPQEGPSVASQIGTGVSNWWDSTAPSYRTNNPYNPNTQEGQVLGESDTKTDRTTSGGKPLNEANNGQAGYYQDSQTGEIVAYVDANGNVSKIDTTPAGQDTPIEDPSLSYRGNEGDPNDGYTGGNNPFSSGGTVSQSGTSKSSNKKTMKTDGGNNDYIKSLQKGMSSQEQAYQQYLNSLDPQYAQTQADYNTQLDTQMQDEINAMVARQASYGTADSEQRDIAQNRIYSDYANKKSDYGRRLNQDKTAEKEKYNLQMVNALAGGNADIAKAMMDELRYQDTQAQQSFSNNLAVQKLNQDNTTTKTNQNQDVFKTAQSLMAQKLQGLPHAYAKPGVQEDIMKQLAGLYGGSANQYGYMFQPGWETNYWQDSGKSAPSGAVKEIMDTYGVDKATAEKMIYAEMYGNPVNNLLNQDGLN